MRAIRSLGAIILICVAGQLPAAAQALEKYVREPDKSYAWKSLSTQTVAGVTMNHLQLTSQTWRDGVWKHDLRLVRPAKVRKSRIALLFITGNGSGSRDVKMLTLLAEEAGAAAAVLTKVPNQPLYNGRNEDALIAYTFSEYLRTGDESWPLLFPMVKSAVRAMDAIQDCVQKEHGEKIEQFLVCGASKRGWTTWLTAAADKRVVAIAPMVIDMLNMKAQTDWAEKVYGRQSEQIADYTEQGLIQKIDTPPTVKLRGWVDPYHYRERYTMPKLILLGTNDPYWTVDSLRHYWDDLPQPKLIFQTPNAGHDLGGGRDATDSLAAFFQMIADGEPLPKVEWNFKQDGKGSLTVKADRPASAIRLWTSDSADRDFRNDKWTSRDLEIKTGSSQASAEVEVPQSGYRACLAEVSLKSSKDRSYKVSTRVWVLPDVIRQP